MYYEAIIQHQNGIKRVNLLPMEVLPENVLINHTYKPKDPQFNSLTKFISHHLTYILENKQLNGMGGAMIRFHYKQTLNILEDKAINITINIDPLNK